jgi:fatty acid desaturase
MKATSGNPLTIEQVRALSATHPYLGLLAVAFRWCIISFSAVAVLVWPYFWTCIPAIFIVGTNMYALYSLAHEGLHYHLHPNKQVNDWISKIFLCMPLGIDFRQMRYDHLQHHKHLGTDNDPEWQHLKYDEFHFPLSRRRLLWISFLDLAGLNYLRYKWMKYAHAPVKTLKAEWKYLLLFSTIITISVWTGTLHVFFFCWLFPYISLYQWLNRIRLYTEHFNLSSNKADTRSLVLPGWQQFFLAPHGLGYHKAHHLYPAVPFYNMHRLHHLLQHQEAYLQSSEKAPSYLHLLKHLSQHDTHEYKSI